MAAGALMSSPAMKVENGSFPIHNKKLSHTLLLLPSIRYLRNVDFSHGRIFVSSSSNPQTEETLLQDFNATSNADHVQVRFQLQRECIFGERFHIVGDDPKLGSWDPTSSIPMDWSEGHVWTVELDDIPVGKKIQFKFILKDGGNQNISWQPGPDRILQTWVTAKTITVSEDWDDSQLQTISEEDLASTNDLVFENEIGDSITAEEEEIVVEEPVSFVEQDLTLMEASVNTTVVFENLESIEDDILVPSESTPVLVPGLTHEEEEEEEDTMKVAEG
ncbi:uncharacterized protein LOC124920079 [Impatiens glandulifera]|uniref:uncharacterized protein LOC124920079 n=1 Tax=Impatiens glandulifera TaxID=253017 RepID=UPI001FB191B6|nr:uncharacterized protein LOC124920079 [Impatiens glandulifera]